MPGPLQLVDGGRVAVAGVDHQRAVAAAIGGPIQFVIGRRLILELRDDGAAVEDHDQIDRALSSNCTCQLFRPATGFHRSAAGKSQSREPMTTRSSFQAVRVFGAPGLP